MATSAKHKHKPVADGTCTACHDPHASDAVKLLITKPLFLCLRCHADIKEEVTKAVSRHGVIETEGCTPCHEVHGSMKPKLLTKNFSNKFSGKFNDDLYQLCFSCHNDTLATSQLANKEETNFRDGKTNLHYIHVVKPSKGRSCKVCHELHGARQKKLIRKTVSFGKGAMMIKIKYTQNPTGGTCVVGCHKPKSYDRKKI